MLQRVRGGVMGAEFGIKVAEDSDANGITHPSIVLDEQYSSSTQLDHMREVEQDVEAEQGECGTAPDHEPGFPAERAGDLALAPPGD